MMDDNDLDRVIDDAARGMTAGEPGASFRARVIARIDERRAPWTRPFVLVPIAAAALIALALFIARDRASHAPARPVPQEASRPPEPAREAVPSLTAGPVTATVRTERPAVARRAIARDSAVAALAPEPLAVPSIALSALEPGDSLRLEELEPIAPIAVAPLGEPQGERR